MFGVNQKSSCYEKNQKEVCLSFRQSYISYLLDEENKRPATSWNKARRADSIAWCEGIHDDWLYYGESRRKDELLERAREICPMHTYKIEKIATKFNEGNFQIKT